MQNDTDTAKQADAITVPTNDVLETTDSSSEADAQASSKRDTPEERDIEFTVDLTSICVKTASVRLPYRAKDLFEEERSMIVYHLEGRREYVLTFSPPRNLSNLGTFFQDTNAKANDRLTLKLHGNQGEIELSKRQTAHFSKRRREALSQPPTKHELLTAANRQLKETKAPEAETTKPDQTSFPNHSSFHGSVRVKGQAMPEAPTEEKVTDTSNSYDAPTATPATPARAAQPDSSIQPDKPSRAEPYSPTAQRINPSPLTAGQNRTGQTKTGQHYTLDDLDDLDDIPDLPPAKMQDPLAGTAHAVTPANTPRPYTAEQVQSRNPAQAETPAEPRPLADPDTMQHLLTLFSNPSTPAILRVDDLAEGVGLSPAKTQAALQALSQGEDAPVRPIRAGVFQILKRNKLKPLN